MIITPHVVSIPPYLSTTWKSIASLHAVPHEDSFQLIVLLEDKTRIVVPNLTQMMLEEIFRAHAKYTHGIDTSLPSLQTNPSGEEGILLLQNTSQHNPLQKDAPDLPSEILEKIAGIIKILGIENTSFLPKPEPHCNCPYCQIARVFQQEDPSEKLKETEEIVSLEDLTFRQWDVVQTEDNLYTVSNSSDTDEQYSVFLGEPLGCTCGHKNCEHIRAVLMN